MATGKVQTEEQIQELMSMVDDDGDADMDFDEFVALMERNDKKIWIRVLRILESSVASEKRQSFRGGAPKPDPASPGRARQPTMATVPKKRFDHRRLSVDVRLVVARELDLEELRKKKLAKSWKDAHGEWHR